MSMLFHMLSKSYESLNLLYLTPNKRLIIDWSIPFILVYKYIYLNIKMWYDNQRDNPKQETKWHARKS